jgi:hypothetical protein
MHPDAISLLRDMRPDPDFEPDERALERILATPTPPRPLRRSRARRRLAVAALTVAAVVATFGALVRDTPDVAAKATAAFNATGTILHYRMEMRSADTPREQAAREPLGRPDATWEVWRSAGGRQRRMLADPQLECRAAPRAGRTASASRRPRARVRLARRPRSCSIRTR